MDCDTREIYSTYQEGEEPIQVRKTSVFLCLLYCNDLFSPALLKVLKFSNDGKLLAIGSGNNIYIYDVTDNQRTYSRLGRCVVKRHFRFFLSMSIN